MSYLSCGAVEFRIFQILLLLMILAIVDVPSLLSAKRDERLVVALLILFKAII